ncbi:MAG: glycosyltransferase [Clostridia bacterium]|nr:glycosyltransferase [Clostridia bacterium]
MRTIKLELKDITETDVDNVRSIHLIYWLNGMGERHEEQVDYQCIDNGERKTIYVELKVPEKSVIDYYYKLITKDGEEIIRDFWGHYYSVGVGSYLKGLEKKYEKRKSGIIKEDRSSCALPRVSVIIPVFNNSKYLPLAIESIMAQNYRSFEVIIVNDGSSEDIDSIINNYSKTSNLKYIKLEKNSGCAYARNQGLKIARGEYVAWLDSDDVYMPDLLGSMVDILDKNEHIDAAFSHHYDYIPNENNLFIRTHLIWCPYCTNFDENDNPIPKPNDGDFCAYRLCSKCGGTGAIMLDKYDYELLKANCYIIHPSAVVRKSLYIKNMGYDLDFHVASDWDFWSRSLNETNGYLLARPLLIKRLHKNSIWQKLRKDKTHEPSYFRTLIKNKFRIKSLEHDSGVLKKRLDFLKGKNVVIYPYNKEVNNVVLFKDMLDFSIAGVIDYTILENGDLGEIVFGEKNGIPIVSDELKAREMIKNADALLLFDVPEPAYDMKNYYTKAETSRFWYELFDTALENYKPVYSTSYLLGDIVKGEFYKEKVKKSGISYFYPEITYSDYIENYRDAQEYEFSYEKFKPKLISFFAIGPNMGKFSSQIMLTNFLKSNGHKVKHISTEPYGDVFGSITACNERFDDYHFKKWFRGQLNKLDKQGYEYIVTGGQGDFFVDVSQRLINCVFPRKIDCVFLVAGMEEDLEQIKTMVARIRKEADISAIILPMFREVSFHKYKKYTMDEFIFKKRAIERETSLEVIELYNDKNGLDKLYGIVNGKHDLGGDIIEKC